MHVKNLFQGNSFIALGCAFAVLLGLAWLLFDETMLEHEVCLDPRFETCIPNRGTLTEDFPELVHSVGARLYALNIPFIGKVPIWWRVYVFKIGDDYFHLDEQLIFSGIQPRRQSRYFENTESHAWRSKEEVQMHVKLFNGRKNFWLKLRSEKE